jgi:hypothetical protein
MTEIPVTGWLLIALTLAGILVIIVKGAAC